MRHARPEALDRLDALIVSLRAMPEINERTRGVFYRKSRAFLHFHEDGEALYADVRLGQDFQRLRVTAQNERAALLKAVREALKG